VATELVLPMLGITVEKGRIIEWTKKEGDPVEKGEVVFVVEVEKATTEVESPVSGILRRILVPEGIEVAVLTVVGVITEPDEDLPPEYMLAEVAHAKARAKRLTGVKTEIPDAATASIRGEVKAVPAARALAKERGLDLGSITGTGPDGVIMAQDVNTALQAIAKTPKVRASTLARRLAEEEGASITEIQGTGIRDRIMRADVRAYLEKVKPEESRLGDVIPMSSVRKVIARRMSESAFTAPHIYFFTEIWLDPLLDFRKLVLSDFEKHFSLRPSLNDFLIKAVALNIIDFPMLNAQLKGEEIHIMPDVNMGLAVAVAEGLIVPAIANADRIGIVEIAKQRADLVDRARAGKLTLLEMERGTFTISSLAQYDITHFTAILNPPQSGILSIGKTDEKLVMSDGKVKVRRVAQFGLSVDHRIIDGAVAADFLQNLKWKMERPSFTFMSL
jgi:pyruvate dehydrogenase E2 component (dihydrolipoamide acetyltransferase)